jgi:DNA-binding CsgD family transcriptional regulator
MEARLNDNTFVDDSTTQARGVADQVAECVRLLATAEHLFRSGELRASGEAAIRAGELARQTGRIDLLAAAALVVTGVEDPLIDAGVEAMCRAALDATESSNATLRARIVAQLAVAQHHRGQVDEAAESSEHAMQLAAKSGDPAASAAALHARQMIAVGLGRPSELIDLGAQMLGLAGRLRSTDSEMLGHAWRIDGYLQLADTAAAVREVDALDVLAARTDEPLVRWHALRSRAGWSHAVGAFAEAERLAALARNALPPSQASLAMPLYYAQVTMIAIDRGVRPAGMDAIRPLAAGRFPAILATIGLLELEVGDRDAAHASLEGVKPRLDQLSRDERWLPTIAAATSLAVAFHDRILAAALYRQLLPFDGLMIAAAIGAYGPVAYFLGLAELSAGRHDDAITRFEAAAELSARGDLAPSLTRARIALAEVHLERAATGDRERAAALLALAVADARRLGMRALLVRATELASSLDRQPSSLSRREREIAAQVASGRSNREIAELLVISERTVETHVQNILTKLDLHSRTQVAVWAAKTGLTEGHT